MPLEQLLRILNASVAPVIVISGVGLLLLSMTNRYGRVIDRARTLVRELEHDAKPARLESSLEQLRILYQRARLIRGAILFCCSSVFCVCLGVLGTFASQILQVERDYLSTTLFVLALVLVSPGVYLFIRDITVSLRALELEIGASPEAAAALKNSAE